MYLQAGWEQCSSVSGQIRKKCVWGNRSEHFRKGRHTYFFFFFWKKNKILCILPFKMHKIIFFRENLKKIPGFTSKFRYGWVTLNADIFYLASADLSGSTPFQTRSRMYPGRLACIKVQHDNG